MTSLNGGLGLQHGLYTQAQAVRLCQVTRGRLKYWIRTGLIAAPKPPGNRGAPPLLSYKNLLQVRALSRFRSSGLPLQRLRKALDYLSGVLDGREDWVQLKLVTDGERLFSVMPSTEAAPQMVEATRQGQRVIELALGELALDVADAGTLVERPEAASWVELNPRVQGGAPVLRGTRIPTRVLAAWRARGWDAQGLADMYGVTERAVQAALAYEAALTSTA